MSDFSVAAWLFIAAGAFLMGLSIGMLWGPYLAYREANFTEGAVEDD